ncbi:hypothetical protein [Pseudomonas helleri]|uniref:hypothetical protein n=1 Tax=Pseudomonas helleri TaxID=1608996 RepID=UPI003FD2EEC7
MEDVVISNAWPSHASDDNSSTPLIRRTDKFLVALITRADLLKSGVKFQEDKKTFNARLALELEIPEVILNVLKETGDLKDED